MPQARFLHQVVIAGACLTILCATVTGAEPDVKVGSKVGNLVFKDTRYLPRSLDDFKERRAFVLVFTTTGCPLVERYLTVLQRLETDFRPKGVQFLAVNVGADDSILDVATQAVEHEMEFPFIKDWDGTCAVKVGAARTPTVVILDEKRVLRYRGRIDDRYRLGGNREEPTREDLREALTEVLAGREVRVVETTVDGCRISRPVADKPRSDVTYAGHIAPLLQKRCVECHRAGGAAPFSLETYKQAAGKAQTIAEVVAEGRMPPWFASPKYGHFVNQRLLTEEERGLVAAWVRGGCVAGDPSDPLLPKGGVGEGDKKDRWLIGKPDLVIKDPTTYTVPRQGDAPYKYTTLPYLFEEDTWVQAVQILPDNPRVVHHCNLGFMWPQEAIKMDKLIAGYVPGGEPLQLEEGVAVCIPKGAVLALQTHLATIGKDEKCSLTVGLKYASGTVQKRLRAYRFADSKLVIPPGAPAYAVKASRVLDEDAIGLSLFAHMHVRGRDVTFRAVNSDDKSETLLMVPNFNFDWQTAYRWEYGKQRFAKGTRLECVAHYDNSAFNPFNPDPRATIREGEQTSSEMMNGFFYYVSDHEKLGLTVDGATGRLKSK